MPLPASKRRRRHVATAAAGAAGGKLQSAIAAVVVQTASPSQLTQSQNISSKVPQTQLRAKTTAIGTKPKKTAQRTQQDQRQRGIHAFAKVSKPRLSADNGEKENGDGNWDEDGDEATGSKRKRKMEASLNGDGDGVNVQGSKRRHVQRDVDVKCDNDENSEKAADKSLSMGILPTQKDSKTKSHEQRANQRPYSSSHIPETPTKGARAQLERLAVASSSPASASVSSSPAVTAPNGGRAQKRARDVTPSSSPPPAYTLVKKSEDRDEDEDYALRRKTVLSKTSVPEPLRDLINLNSAFLTALSIHYAHHGTSAPVELSDLQSGIEKAWKRRHLNLDDFRQILDLMQRGEKKVFELVDYGRERICIELLDTRATEITGNNVFDEPLMKKKLARNLLRLWNRSQVNGKYPLEKEFLSTLPMAQIKAQTPITTVKKPLSKGQQRLQDLKAGAIKAQERALIPTSANLSPNPAQPKEATKSAGNRASALLDRLHAKALHQSTLKAPPSPEEVARRRALQRLPEIAPVISSLIVGGQKHNNDDTGANNEEDGMPAVQQTRHMSFTVPTMIQNLQMSMRNPIAVDEAVRSLRCLAELVPEWVGMREIGRLSVLTVRGEGVGKAELERRVKGVLDRE